MLAVFKDFYNRFHLGYFKIVDSAFCDFTHEAVYLGNIKRKKGIYALYQVYDEIIAVLTLDWLKRELWKQFPFLVLITNIVIFLIS